MDTVKLHADMASNNIAERAGPCTQDGFKPKLGSISPEALFPNCNLGYLLYFECETKCFALSLKLYLQLCFKFKTIRSSRNILEQMKETRSRDG